MGENRFVEYEKFSHISPFDFAKQSSIGVGGKAEIAFCPHTVEETIALLQKLQKEKRPYIILGNMTNVLPGDEDTQRAVILTRNLNGLKMTDTGVFAYAGVKAGTLWSVCKRNERSDVEFLYGIPCTLGGALYMNAGADGRYMQEIVQSVLVYRNGEKRWLSITDCLYDYKESIFMHNDDVVLGAELRLSLASEEEISARERYFATRREHLPKGKSMGCVFKNPVGRSAGELIEKSGLKGLRIGGAHISNQHANFIINDDGATAKDIKTLIEIIKNAVKRQYDIQLEEEIRRI